MPIVQAILETIEADMTKAQIVGISQVLKCFKHPKDPKGKSFLNDRPSFQYKRNDQLLFNWHQLSAVRRLIRYRLTPLQSVTPTRWFHMIPMCRLDSPCARRKNDLAIPRIVSPACRAQVTVSARGAIRTARWLPKPRPLRPLRVFGEATAWNKSEQAAVWKASNWNLSEFWRQRIGQKPL